MELLALALIGAVLGHLARRATPLLLGLADRGLPFRWPWVEAVGALTFVWAGAVRGTAPEQWQWLVLATLLLAIASADQHSKYIPGQLCYAGIFLGVGFSALYPVDILELFNQERFLDLLGVPIQWLHFSGGLLAIFGALMGWLQMTFIRRIFGQLAQMEVMGAGDALLMAMAGAFLGPQGILFALFPACLIGVAMGGAAKLFADSVHFPFGPALALGSMLIALHGDDVLEAIRWFHGALYDLPPWALLGVSLGLIALLIYLVLRLKRKAAHYERMIEEDYKKIDEKMKK